MGRLILASILLTLSGCAAVLTTVASVPGFLVEGMFSQTQGDEESFAISMKTALAATQQGLQAMKLDADLMEPREDGAVVMFGNARFDGVINLQEQTPQLTTFYVKVRNGMKREASIERAVLDVMHKKADAITDNTDFVFAGYEPLRERPFDNAKLLAWIKTGAKVEVLATTSKGWSMIRLPSRKTAYLHGIPAKLRVSK